MICFQQASLCYNGHFALNQVSFSIDAGEMVFLTGHSGAGKTSLLKLMLCLERPTSGVVLLGQKDIARIRTRHAPMIRRQIGFVSQHPALLPRLSLYENIAMPLFIAGWDKRKIESRVMAALEKVGLRNCAGVLPHTLSCGEQQRAGIARAIVHKPAILLADEPTGNLDPALAEEMMQLFESFNAVGVTVLIATHAQALVDKRPQRVLTLSGGRLIGDQR